MTKNTMSVLDEICARKRAYVEEQKQRVPLDELKQKIKSAPHPLGFIERIKNTTGTAIIAEVKKASPSEGVIREGFDAVQTARIYEDHGAACLSVLTDTPYFQGRDEYLENIKSAVNLPLLRKDFMIDPYQICESRALGADCILLIMAALSDEDAQTMHDLAEDLGMDALVEIHNMEELGRALSLAPRMIGVNNRDLKTLDVDVQTSIDLLEHIPERVVKVAESGISKRKTIEQLENIGYDAFLIGTSLMRAPDIGAALENLLSPDLTQNKN